ncbi:MAG: hypothetical protein C0407_14520 [Desulfobacca sp.]|nr:hypothetical protein [Desulfobacca sp.]
MTIKDRCFSNSFKLLIANIHFWKKSSHGSSKKRNNPIWVAVKGRRDFLTAPFCAEKILCRENQRFL